MDFSEYREQTMKRARQIAETTDIDIPTWIGRVTKQTCPFDDCRGKNPLLTRGQVLQGGCDDCFVRHIRRHR